VDKLGKGSGGGMARQKDPTTALGEFIRSERLLNLNLSGASRMGRSTSGGP
jgi:hypothetical protein